MSSSAGKAQVIFRFILLILTLLCVTLPGGVQATTFVPDRFWGGMQASGDKIWFRQPGGIITALDAETGDVVLHLKGAPYTWSRAIWSDDDAVGFPTTNGEHWVFDAATMQRAVRALGEQPRFVGGGTMVTRNPSTGSLALIDWRTGRTIREVSAPQGNIVARLAPWTLFEQGREPGSGDPIRRLFVRDDTGTTPVLELVPGADDAPWRQAWLGSDRLFVLAEKRLRAHDMSGTAIGEFAIPELAQLDLGMLRRAVDVGGWRLLPDGRAFLVGEVPEGTAAMAAFDPEVKSEGEAWQLAHGVLRWRHDGKSTLLYKGDQGTWSGELEYGRIWSVLEYHGRAYLGVESGIVECIDLASGRSKWLYGFPVQPRSYGFSFFLLSAARESLDSQRRLRGLHGMMRVGGSTSGAPPLLQFDPDPPDLVRFWYRQVLELLLGIALTGVPLVISAFAARGARGGEESAPGGCAPTILEAVFLTVIVVVLLSIARVVGPVLASPVSLVGPVIPVAILSATRWWAGRLGK